MVSQQESEWKYEEKYLRKKNCKKLLPLVYVVRSLQV